MPLVHGKIDVVSVAAVHFRPYRISRYFKISILSIDPHSMPGDVETVYVTDDLFLIAVALCVELLTVIECQPEADSRAGKRHPLDDIYDLAAFGPHGSDIFQTGRGIEEQFTDGYIRPLTFLAGPLFFQLPAFNPYGHRFPVDMLCFHLRAGHSTDTCQRLAAESE